MSEQTLREQIEKARQAVDAFRDAPEVALIGKPRKPLTAGIAIATLICQGLLSVGAYYLYASAS